MTNLTDLAERVEKRHRRLTSCACGWASIAMINCVVNPYESKAECPTWTNFLRDFNRYLSELGLLNRILTGFCSIVAILLTNWYMKSLTLKKVNFNGPSFSRKMIVGEV